MQRRKDSAAGNQDRLKADLEARGVPHIEVYGVYEGNPDGVSFMVAADEATVAGTLSDGRRIWKGTA